MQPAAAGPAGEPGPWVAAGAQRRGPLVVVIGASATERMEVVRRLGPDRPVLIVSDVEQARGLLGAESEAEDAGETPSAPVVGLRLLAGRRAVHATGRGEAALTPLEYAVLECLLASAGRVCTFATLSRHGWRTGHLGGAAHVHAVVKRLRRKLGQVGAAARIEAVRGVGFRLCAPAGSGQGPRSG